MKRCATSHSCAELTAVGQLLWHRLVHDGGVNQWGIALGDARSVWHDCIALTLPSATIEEIEEQLALMESLGMIVRYEMAGATYLATCNHEQYCKLSRRAVPDHPMPQEVADTRDWRKLNSQGSQKENANQWARRWGLTLDFDAEPSPFMHSSCTVHERFMHSSCTVQHIQSPSNERCNTNGVVVKRSEESGSEACGDDQKCMHARTPLTDEARTILKSAGIPIAAHAVDELTEDQLAQSDGDPLVCLVALALDCQSADDGKKTPPKVRMKFALGRTPNSTPDVPTVEAVAKARQMLGIAESEQSRASPDLKCLKCGRVWSDGRKHCGYCSETRELVPVEEAA